ncbi:MAG: hypothetical protein IKK57_00215 [Clostridia bacterium]|nr:hypothetical protein [Clostridia bacterium]
MMEKIKNFYGSHPIRWTLLTLAVVAAVIALIWYAPAFSMKADECPLEAPAVSVVGEEIPFTVNYLYRGANKRKADTIVVAEQNGRTLTLDPVEMIFTLTDEQGNTWSSAMPGAKEGLEKCLLMLEYVGEDNVFTTLNSYDAGTMLYAETAEPVLDANGEVISNSTYVYYDHIYRIENGVRIEMRILDSTREYNAYMPKIMPLETYNWFLMRIEELQAAGVEVKYVKTFMDHYNKPDPLDPNKIPLQGSYPPSLSARNQIIDLALQIGYTSEMLAADCALYGEIPGNPQLASFSVVLEVSLNADGELIAHIPTDQIVSHNDYFSLQRIHVLPNLCAEAASADAQGYFLVPDGSGALMKFNSSDGTIPDVLRPYMNNDYINDYYFQSEYGEELMMPVFGVMYGGAESTHGMLAIIEKGAETANLHVSLATPTTGKNRAYISVDTLEHSWVRIYGAYADNQASYLATSGHIDTDFTVRYVPYGGKVTYYDMAMTYRDYLAEKAGMTVQAPKGPGLYLEMMGAVTLTERFVGVPYNAINSMTTFADASEIISELSGHGVAYQYDGAFNGGMLSGLNDGLDLVKQNGSASDLAQLIADAKAAGSDLFLQVNMSRVYENGRDYIPYLHAMRDYSNSPMTVYLYRADTAQMNGRWDPIREYTLVSPRYFGYLAEQIRADLAEDEALAGASLAIGDLAGTVYADYRYKDVIDPVQSRAYVTSALETISADGAALSLSNPFADVVTLGAYAVDVSRQSSGYAAYYADVPFRQLALSGLTQVVSTDVNLSSRDVDYFLMQAAELGMSVKYTISAQNPDVLKSSHFEAMYAVHWDAWKDEIMKVAAECDALREMIGGHAIVNHELLLPQVFRTTYEGDVVVITNYSALPYESTEGTVAPGTYLLVAPVQEGGAL